jgi:hypothetical protein
MLGRTGWCYNNKERSAFTISEAPAHNRYRESLHEEMYWFVWWTGLKHQTDGGQDMGPPHMSDGKLHHEAAARGSHQRLIPIAPQLLDFEVKIEAHRPWARRAKTRVMFFIRAGVLLSHLTVNFATTWRAFAQSPHIEAVNPAWSVAMLRPHENYGIEQRMMFL